MSQLQAQMVLQGNGIGSTIKQGLMKVHDFAKKHKLVSRGLEIGGYNQLSQIAKNLGYGNKKKKNKKTKRK